MLLRRGVLTYADGSLLVQFEGDAVESCALIDGELKEVFPEQQPAAAVTRRHVWRQLERALAPPAGVTRAAFSSRGAARCLNERINYVLKGVFQISHSSPLEAAPRILTGTRMCDGWTG